MPMSFRRRTTLLTCAFAAALALAACGGDDDGTAADVPPPGSPTMTIKDFKFSSLTVEAGTAVRVENEDSAPHDVTEVDEKFESGEIGGNDVGTFTAPDEPGTYRVFCTIHPDMRSRIRVT